MAYENGATDAAEPAKPSAGGVQYVEAGEGDAGQRLDNFLVRVLKGVPRTHVYRLLRKGEVRVNSKRAKPDQRVSAGDRIRLPPIRRPEPVAPVVPTPARPAVRPAKTFAEFIEWVKAMMTAALWRTCFTRSRLLSSSAFTLMSVPPSIMTKGSEVSAANTPARSAWMQKRKARELSRL